jgi:hypothetical protein
MSKLEKVERSKKNVEGDKEKKKGNFSLNNDR